MRTAVASCAAIATAVGVGACGGASVPSNAVAIVGSAPVTNAQFNHWMTVANNQPYVNSGDTPPALPVPPKYTACIASERVRDPSGAASTFEAECAATYKQLNDEVTALLIEGIWFQGEAFDRHVTVTKAAINASWNQERKTNFATPAKLNAFLGESGYTISDLKWVAMLNLLQQGIVTKVEKSAGHVSAARIASYYKSHLSQYTFPERRNIELVLVSSVATETKVKSLLAGGASFATVAKEYSIDPTTKDTGGVQSGVEQGEETPIFNAAIFNAPVGVLESTGKTPFGYYVFKVTAAMRGSVASLAASRDTIKMQLVEQAQTAAVDALRTSFVTKWKARTTCASGHLVAQVCSNAPATASTGASGTTGAT
jgi:foldase protein PrsA